ncbi:hypothetical protein [Algoriphagus sp.]|uniref:hypothetical protein n=1 Tax=Algoriphagus sp. TaxID=1872435 RepID=UPI003F7289F9
MLDGVVVVVVVAIKGQVSTVPFFVSPQMASTGCLDGKLPRRGKTRGKECSIQLSSEQGDFFGKEGAARGVALKFKQVYGKYETRASTSLLTHIDKVKVILFDTFEEQKYPKLFARGYTSNRSKGGK